MIYKFDDIAYNITTKRVPTSDDKSTYIGLEHLDSGELYVKRYGSDVDLKGDKLVMTKGDILFGKRNTYLKRVAIAPFDGLFSAHGMIFHPKEDVIDKRYFPFFINSDAFMDEAIRISVGSLSPTVNWKDLKDLEFDIPPIEEQKQLADKLWAAYDLKSKYANLIKSIDEMVKSQFIEMFGSMINPKYDVLPMVSVCERSGQYGSNTSACDHITNTPRYIRITDINDDGSLNDDIKSAEAVDDKYLLKDGDLVFARTGATVGKTYLHHSGKAIYAGYLIKYHPIESRINPEYLFAYTHSSSYYAWVELTKKVGAQPNISATQYDELPVIVPPIDKQKEFVMIAQQADKSKSVCRQAIKRLAS